MGAGRHQGNGLEREPETARQAGEAARERTGAHRDREGQLAKQVQGGRAAGQLPERERIAPRIVAADVVGDVAFGKRLDVAQDLGGRVGGLRIGVGRQPIQELEVLRDRDRREEAMGEGGRAPVEPVALARPPQGTTAVGRLGRR
jgi:hypothetical protein